MRFAALCWLLASTWTLAAQVQLTSGVQVNPGVRYAQVQSGEQTPALAQPIASGSTSASFAQAQGAHHLNIVIIAWYDATRSLTNGACGAPVCDTTGNTYAVAAPTATYSAFGLNLRQAIYYAKDIAAAVAGNVVTPTWDGTPTTPSVRIMEVSGLDPSTPLDVYAAGSGTATAGAPSLATTDPATTTSAVEFLVGAGISTSDFSAAGSDYTLGLQATGSILEHRNVTTVAAYNADAWTNGQAQSWLMQLATFRAAGQTIMVPTPTVTAISPTRGRTNQTTAVTITGTDFRSGAAVSIGGSACGAITVVSATQITCTAPAQPAAVADVAVTNPGSDAGTLAGAFTYGVYLTVASSPAGSGRFTSTDGRIVCSGSCTALLDNGYSISVDAAPATGYAFNNWTATTCDTISGARCTDNMGTADWTSTANFTATNTYMMTVSRTVDGTVSAAGGTVAGQAPHAEIQCGATCSYAYPAGTQLVLKATPAAGYSFKDWKNSSGYSTCDIANGDTCTLNVGAAPWTAIANFTPNASTGDYYVSPTGNDGNNGTSLATAWATIQHAADTVPSGKTVLIKAGTYKERVSVTRPGITFIGEKNGDSFQTIIDPTSCVSPACGAPANFWIVSGLGSNVYEHDFGGAQDVNNLMAGSNRRVLWRIANNRWDAASQSAQWILTQAAGATYQTSNMQCTLPFWDGIEAAFAVHAGVTYLRFKNGTNPNTLALYGENRATAYDSATAGVVAVAAANTAIKNLWIRGGRIAVSISGVSGVSILDDKLEGPGGVRLTSASNALIDGNDISVNGYVLAGDFDYSSKYDYNAQGPWENVPNAHGAASRRCMQEYIYSPVVKQWGGTGSGIGDYVGVYDGGGNSGTVVSNNHMFDTNVAIRLGWVGTASSDWDIHDNRIEYSSADVINTQNYVSGVRVHDNTFAHVNTPLRVQGMGSTGSDDLYFYKNRSWDFGEASYFFQSIAGTPSNHIYIYNNSFAAGSSTYNERILMWSGNVVSSANVHFFNNLTSAGGLALQWTDNHIPVTAADFGRYGYNWIGGNHGASSTFPAWTPKTGNIIKPSGTWAWGTPSLTTEPSWITPADGVGKGITCSTAFTLGSSSFPALPGCTGTSPDMGAAMPAPAGAYDYYVSPAGSDSNDGTAATTGGGHGPWLTIAKAISVVGAGKSVLIEAGTYSIATRLWSQTAGTSSQPINYVCDYAINQSTGARTYNTHINSAVTGGNYTWVVDGAYTTVEGCDFSSAGNSGSIGGLKIDGDYDVARNNRVHDVPSDGAGAGIMVGSSGNYQQVVGNQVYNLGATNATDVQGIYVQQSNGKVQNNLLWNCKRYCIQVWSGTAGGQASGNLVSGNTMYNAYRCFNYGGANGIYPANNLVTGNVCRDSYHDYAYMVASGALVGTGNVLSYNHCYNALTACYYNLSHTNDISGDPLFVNYQADGTGDYHLQSTSPARDAVPCSNMPATDAQGIARPQGTQCDAGAYEYH